MTSVKKRDDSIELFRIFCMLAICMQHAVVFSNTGATGFESRYWNIGVVGFAFITGYYGTSFKLMKLINLWLTALWCVGAVTLIAYISRGGVNCVSFCDFKYMLFSNWYLNGYTVLLLMTPILNAAVEKLFAPGEEKARRIAIVAFSILLIWSWLQELWGVRDYVPRMPDMGKMSFMTLIYIYLIGRWDRLLGDVNVANKKIWIAWIGCLVLIPFLGSNNSIVTLFYTIVVFHIFRCFSLPPIIGKIVAFIVPSIFAVYLLHTNEIGFSLILRFVHELMEVGLPRYAAYAVCALSAIAICLFIDIPRRLAFRLVRNAFDKHNIRALINLGGT